MSDSNNVCPFTFRANPCDSIESPPTEHWTARLCGACPEGIRAAAAYDTPEAAWAGIDRPDFLVWAVEKYAGAPSTTQSVRLALEVAKAVEHLYDDDDATEVLARVERSLNGEALDVGELRTMLEYVYRAPLRSGQYRSECLSLVAHDDHGAHTHARQALAHNQEIEALRATFHAGYALVAAVEQQATGGKRYALKECARTINNALCALSDEAEAKHLNLVAHLDDHAAAFGSAPAADNLDAIKGLADLVRKHFTRPTVLDEQD